MKILRSEEVEKMSNKRKTIKDSAVQELQAFLDSGEQWAELDRFEYSLGYAFEAYRGFSKRLPQFRGKVAMHIYKYRIIAERLEEKQ